jgi:hypothetical protein
MSEEDAKEPVVVAVDAVTPTTSPTKEPEEREVESTAHFEPVVRLDNTHSRQPVLVHVHGSFFSRLFWFVFVLYSTVLDSNPYSRSLEYNTIGQIGGSRGRNG